MPVADLGEVRLFHTDDGPAGTGAVPLLLVHGFAADGTDWAPHVAALAADRRVIVPDLRGHGASSAPETGYRPEDLAGDLVRLLDRLEIGQAVVIGHSMGAQVGSALAVEHPGRVRALVCVDPAYGQPPEVAAYFGGMVEGLAKDPYAAVLAMEPVLYTPATPQDIQTRHTRMILRTPTHVLRQGFPAMFTDEGSWGVRPASDAYLIRRECPVLACWASTENAAWESTLFKHPASQALAWPGAGHRLHEERPAEFVVVVRNWLNRLDKEMPA